MIALDEDSLICDLAQTYQIYDYKQLPVSKVAVFSLGLKQDSRIKMKLSGESVPLETILLAGMLDRLSLLLWSKTKDASKGVNRPAMIISKLCKTDEPMQAFSSGEEFERVRGELIGGGD